MDSFTLYLTYIPLFSITFVHILPLHVTPYKIAFFLNILLINVNAPAWPDICKHTGNA